MLDLAGGRCMSGLDAVAFFELLPDMIDEDAKTEAFCEEYTWALNRLRYEVRKSMEIKAVKVKGKFVTFKCGNCGGGLRSDIDNYCPHCGREIDWEV